MGNETSKNKALRESRYEYDFLKTGKGLDIGCGNDPINPWCDRWDKAQGDATFMENAQDFYYDWVHSSHCLEHLAEPRTAVHNWWRLLKPGGHLLITVPCFFLYEKKSWPSSFNRDHKQKFTLLEKKNTLSLLSLFENLHSCQIRWAKTNDLGFDYSNRVKDQTSGTAQSELEVCARKVTDPFWTDIT